MGKLCVIFLKINLIYFYSYFSTYYMDPSKPLKSIIIQSEE